MSTESRTREAVEALSTEPCSVNMLKITCEEQDCLSPGIEAVAGCSRSLGFPGCSWLLSVLGRTAELTVALAECGLAAHEIAGAKVRREQPHAALLRQVDRVREGGEGAVLQRLVVDRCVVQRADRRQQVAEVLRILHHAPDEQRGQGSDRSASPGQEGVCEGAWAHSGPSSSAASPSGTHAVCIRSPLSAVAKKG